jgi:hypothetical protein
VDVLASQGRLLSVRSERQRREPRDARNARSLVRRKGYLVPVKKEILLIGRGRCACGLITNFLFRATMLLDPVPGGRCLPCVLLSTAGLVLINNCFRLVILKLPVATKSLQFKIKAGPNVFV